MIPLDKNIVPLNIQKDNVTQSLYTYNKVFNQKGYVLLCAYQDIFFIKKEYAHLFEINNNLIEHYLNGLKHLPRIPWIYEKAKQYNIKNEIIEYIISKTNNKNIKNRNLWVNDNYEIIQISLSELLKKYNIIN